jgi:flagellar biosynthetic protein FliP
VPLRAFMLRQTREKDLALFAQMAKTPELQGPEDVPLRCWCRRSSPAN